MPKVKIFYGYIVVFAAFCIALVMWGTYYTFGVFFEPLLSEFDWTRATTSGAVSLSLFFSGLLCIVMGRLTDRFGPRIVITACGIFLGSGYLLMSQISIIWHLYIFYGILLAVGMAGAFVPLVSTTARWFVKRRGLMTGLVVAGVGVGTMITAPIARWLISSYGWRNSYLIIGTVAPVVIILAAQFLRRDPGQMGQLPYGQTLMEERGSNLEAGFSLQETIHTRQLWLLCGIYFCGFLPIGTMLVHIVIHATGLGIPAITASSILATIGGVSVAGRVTMGAIADRVGNKLSLFICFILLSIALLWLMAAKEAWMLYLFAIILGFAYGGMNSLQSLITAELFGTASLGAVLGIIFAFDSAGAAVGPVIAGRIFDITSGYQPAFLLCTAMAAIALILVLFLRPISKEREGIELNGRA